MIYFLLICPSLILAVLLLLHKKRHDKKILIVREKFNALSNKYDKLLSQKKSSETRLGQISEHFAPLLNEFEYNRKETRFLGSPIDYVCFDFENEQIVFIEFKTGESSQSVRQRKVRDIVKSGRVYYELMRVKDKVSKKREDNVQRETDRGNSSQKGDETGRSTEGEQRKETDGSTE